MLGEQLDEVGVESNKLLVVGLIEEWRESKANVLDIVRPARCLLAPRVRLLGLVCSHLVIPPMMKPRRKRARAQPEMDMAHKMSRV
jgi:hypothetical protein